MSRPFGPDRFGREDQDAVRALWKWFDLSGSDRATLDDAARLRAGAPPSRLPMTPWKLAVSACERFGADPAELADRVEASARLRNEDGPETGGDLGPFIDLLVGKHASILARARRYRGSWQQRGAADFARGLVLLDYLWHAPEYARRGLSLFATDELENAGLTVGALAGASSPSGYRPLAWKQSIRARDALASARGLIMDMDLRDRLYARRLWLSALERIDLLDREDFDTWASKPAVSLIARTRIGIQSIFGRTAFRST